MLFVETRVSRGDQPETNLRAEDSGVASLSYSGTGCRPTRRWVFRELKKHFEHVYIPRTQPNHDEFPLDWRDPEADAGSMRAVFVASRVALESPMLTTELLDVQQRQV